MGEVEPLNDATPISGISSRSLSVGPGSEGDARHMDVLKKQTKVRLT